MKQSITIPNKNKNSLTVSTSQICNQENICLGHRMPPLPPIMNTFIISMIPFGH